MLGETEGRRVDSGRLIVRSGVDWLAVLGVVRKGLVGVVSGAPKPDGGLEGVPPIEANGLVGLSGDGVPRPDSCRLCCNCCGVVGSGRTGLAKGLV